MLTKIASGGQTGADKAALDVAVNLGFSHGGWIPKGRRAEDGQIPSRYELKEMQTDRYPERTKATRMLKIVPFIGVRNSAKCKSTNHIIEISIY